MTKITYIPGEIANAAIDEHGNRKPVTRTQHIFDDTKGRNQAQINADVDDKFTQLDNEIEGLEKQDVIPVDTLPAVATADPKKIYRVVGEDSYTDYMVNASGDDWKTLATYSFPGIDDEPTVGSNNLVKSDGVAETLIAVNIEDVEGESGTIYVNGNKTSTSSYIRYFIKNKNFTSVSIKTKADSAFGTLCFYNSETADSSSLISAVAGGGASSFKTKTENVPSTCQLIGITTTVESLSEGADFSIFGTLKSAYNEVTNNITDSNDIPTSGAVYNALGVVNNSIDSLSLLVLPVQDMEEHNGWVDSSGKFVMNNYGKHKVCKINKDKPFLRVKAGTGVRFIFFVLNSYIPPTGTSPVTPDFADSPYDGYNATVPSTVAVFNFSDVNNANYIAFNSTLNSGSVDYNPIEFDWFSEFEYNQLIASKEWYEEDSVLKNRIIQLQRRENANKDYSSHPKILSLLHFSDLHNGVIDANHNNLMQLQRLLRFASMNETYINDVVCTGDMIDYYDDPFGFWANAGADKVLISLGNHEDVWVEKDSVTGEVIYPVVSHRDTTISQQMMYEKYFAPFVSSHTGVVQSENKVYWYKDYTNEKIRLISIYNYLYFVDSETKEGSVAHAEQLSWFEGALESARTSGLSVVLLNHFPIGLEKIQSNFTNVATSLDYAVNNLDDFMDRIEAFKTAGGEFICHVAGHTHSDFIGYKNTYPEQLFVTVANSSLENIYSDFTRVRGERCQDTFNIISFDTYTKHIKIVRVGANVDYCMRDRNAICINYLTKAIISQS